MSLSPLSKRILKLRKERKMTQGALAKKVGVSTTAISQFEKGSSGPSLETLTKLSDALGEDLRELVPRIGRFPILSTENNIDVPIISGNQYNRLQWDYLRRDESDLPSAKEEASYNNSRTAYAYESLSLPPSLLEKGQHLVYPMPGNQMAPVFEKGDLLLCSLIEDRNEWREMGEDTDDFEAIDVLPVYVVEVWKEKERLIHFGRFSINEKRQTLRCYLDDRSMPYRIPFADIKGLWKFRWCLTSRYYNQTQNLLDRIRELEYKVAKLSSGGPLSEHSDNSPAYRTFRERLSEIIIGQQIAEGEFLKGDYIDLANDKEVQELYVREYGPIQNHQGYMKSMEGIILEMVRKLSPEVQRAIHGESVIKKKAQGFSGDFRDDLKNLLQSQVTKREDIDKLDFVELANDERVREFYVNEYGPITDNKKYISNALQTMQSVAFEVTLGLPYPEVKGLEQTRRNSLT
jgi:transcriptional regulator with XRE-family HTH domain